jgi:hypothetical protein
MKSQNDMVLVGLGRIGYKGFPQTHFQCGIGNNLNVVAGVDSSAEARARFTSETGIPSYKTLAELSDENWSSFFSVACSNDAAFEILTNLLSRKGPQGILTEKPFCSSAAQSQQILGLQANVQTPLRINYLRQYTQAMSETKSLIANSKFISGVVIYSSGLRENGSHFIRLICALFPSIISSQNITSINGAQFSLRISDNQKIDFVSLESPYLHTSEIRLIFEDLSVSISEGFKIEVRRINTNSLIRNWPRELELILDADLSDGFESSYLDQSWWRSPNQESISQELKLDHLCNVLIEKVLIQNFSTSEKI